MDLKLAIGQMRQAVDFLVNTPTTAATSTREAVTTGGRNDFYLTLLSTRGRLRKKTGNRTVFAGMVELQESWELICRFQSTLESNLRNDVKILIDNKLYTINSWEKMDEKKHLYRFQLNASSETVTGSYPGIGVGSFVIS